MGKEKKEIGMEKLIELLNEREKTVNGVQYPGWCKEHLDYQCHGPRVINKRFGFIKWLVENDKIDFEGMSGHANIIKYLRDVKKCNRNQIKEGVVLMLLSISSSPIEDLLLYLK